MHIFISLATGVGGFRLLISESGSHDQVDLI